MPRIGLLDAAIKEMGTQAEQDRKFVREVLHEMALGIAQLSVNADADRQEIIRLSVNADADRAAIQAVIQEVHIINERFTRLESQRNGPQ